MANGPTRVCVFNVKANQQFAPPVVPNQTGSNLIDIVTGCDGVVVSSLGAASYGVPVVLNPNGVIDPSLLNTGVSAVASVNLSLGAPLVHLYSVGGVLTAELAEAGSGSPPSPALSAQGFLTSPIDAGQPGTIAFSGLFTYIDPNSEFSLSSVGAEVYLSAVTPGGITLTRPSSPSLDQTVGYVVAFTAPNVVTAIFLAGYNDFTRISGCLSTSQICSVQGTGAFVQLTSGAPPPSPVTTQLGSSANYAILAAAGITNAAPATSITGGVIGSFPTTSITGFNPPTATIDNTHAAAALTAALSAYNHYSGLTFTSLSGSSADLSVLGNGANASTYNAGNYSAGSSMDIPTTITLDAQGNPNAVFVFKAGSTVTLESGASILLVNGAQAANVVWIVGSSFTSVATSTMVGNILANTSITLGGGILTGRALAGIVTSSGAVTIPAATAITVPSGAGSIIAGDIVTFDAFGNTLDSGISLAGVLSSIFVNPMTTAGDIIYETSGPLGPARLPIGTTGQALTVVGGFPAWGNVVNSFNTRTGAVTFTLADIPQSGATTGEAIVWNGSAWAPSSAATTSFADILTGDNTTATMTVDTGASLSYTGSGVINASELGGVAAAGYALLSGATFTGTVSIPTLNVTTSLSLNGTVTLLDGTGSAGTSGYVLSSTGTGTAWIAPSGGGGTPAAPSTSVQFNNSGLFGGSANFEWNGTTVQVTGATSTSGPDVMDLYTFGSVTPGIAVQQYSDAQGLGLSFTDAAGDNVTVFPYRISGNNAAFTSSFSIQPGSSAGFNNLAVTISGDAFGSDILDLEVHGVGTPAVSVDQYGQIKQGGGTPLVINYTANPDPQFLNQYIVANNNVGAAASLSAYGHSVSLAYKGSAGSPTFATVFGASITATTDPSTTDNISALYGATIFAYPQGSGGVGELIGINVQAGQSTNGALTLCEPLQVRSAFTTSTANVGAINFIHVYALSGTGSGLTGSPTINGVLIDDQGAATAPAGSVSYGLHINSQSGAGNFAISVDGGKSYFGGNVILNAELIDGAASPGTSGQVLSSTGTGTLWIPAPTTAPGGSPTEIQYNNGGVFDGIAGSAVDTSGDVTISPTADVDTALTVLGTVGGTNLIASFGTTGSYDVMDIAPPNNTGSVTAVTIQGDGANDTLDVFVNTIGVIPVFTMDAFGDVNVNPQLGQAAVAALTVTGGSAGGDIQDWYATAGSPPTPVVAIDSDGNLHVNEGLYDSANSLGTSGQVLTSTGSQILWGSVTQGPLSNTPVSQTVRFTVGTVATGAVQGPYAINFTTPFADNNYTVQVSIVGLETAPGTPTIAAFPSLGIAYVAYQAAGVGVNVWIANHDSIVHTAYIQVTAIHD